MRQLLFSMLLLLANSAFAQIKMSEALKSMPDSLIPYLTENNRLDLVDFREAGMHAQVSNAFDGISSLTQLTADYASLRLSEASQVDLWLLTTTSGRPMLCVVSTYGKDIRESRLSFYTTDWYPLPTSQYVTLPDYSFVATADAERKTLTLTRVNDFDRPANEEQNQLENVQTTLNWDGLKFK